MHHCALRMRVTTTMACLLPGNGCCYAAATTRLLWGMWADAEWSARLSDRNHKSLVRVGTFRRSMASNTGLAEQKLTSIQCKYGV